MYLGDGDPRSLPPALDKLFTHADHLGATDIHIDCWQAEGAVRLRVDGVILNHEELGRDAVRRLINQIKAAAEMHIDGSMTAQEGHLRWHGPRRPLDARVTIVPTAPHHESVHIRLLPPPSEALAAEHLGLRPAQLERIKHLLQHTDGLTLISGPTGAGKSTTLYALLSRDKVERKVAIAIEDPAEFDLPYVRQIEIDEDHGRGMSEALRLALRMDPDVLAVGEICDRDSSRIASHAALSGRTVFATIHGKDAAAAIEAMHFLGAPFYVLAGALRLVVAQDLVRVLCKHCKKARALTQVEQELFARHLPDEPAPAEVCEPVGCDHCHKLGYAGRIGVFQVADFEPGHAAWLSEEPDQNQIRRQFKDQGIHSLTAEALLRVIDGTTSLAECSHIIED